MAVGFVFHDEAYATNFFDLLRAWNHGKDDDTENNIRLSFITDEDVYYTFLYPSPRREPIRKSWRSLRRAARRRGKDKEPFLLMVSYVICKEFSTRAGYSLGLFADSYKQGKPFDLLAYRHRDSNSPELISGIAPIRKYHLKARALAYLETDEFERVHLSRVRA